MIDIEELERLAKAAPQGSWETWTSCSWRRIMATDGANTERVIEPTYHPKDKWPDLMFGNGVREYVEAVQPSAILELIAETRQLREDLQAAKLLAHANVEMFRAEKAVADQYRQAQKDCQTLSFELLGAVIDTEQGHGFDSVCLNTIKRVRDRLHEMATTKPGS